jgi:hypothetical protein
METRALRQLRAYPLNTRVSARRLNRKPAVELRGFNVPMAESALMIPLMIVTPDKGVRIVRESAKASRSSVSPQIRNNLGVMWVNAQKPSSEV